VPVTIIEPVERQRLWRYMSLEKLLSLLQRGLHFAQLKTFKDPQEGTAPKVLIWKGKGDQPMVPMHVHDDPTQLYVCCWHRSADESAAMWSIYSGTGGVAVTTTLDRLAVALKDSPQNVEIAEVHYITPPPSGVLAAGSPWTVKRPSFSHEKEVRAVFRDPECGRSGIYIPVNVAGLIERIYVSPESESWIEEVVENVVAKYGLSAPVRRSDLYTLL